MPEITNVKDVTPNQHLIDHLKLSLEQVESGDVRSMVLVKMWNDGKTYHEWIIDPRSSQTKMLGATELAKTELSIKIAMQNESSVFVSAVRDILEL